MIVGASLAGAKAAETLREEGFAGRVVLIGEETEPPYERPPLSKGYLLGAEPREKAFVHEPQLVRRDTDIEWRPGTTAVALDLAARTVTLHPADTVAYDKLLLATGSRVRTLTRPGADLAGRALPADRSTRPTPCSRPSSSAGHVVVVGAGWIGLETAAAAAGNTAARSPWSRWTRCPLRRVLGDEVATVYRDLHAAHGVDFRFGAGLREIVGTDGAVTGVVLDDGWEVAADLVVAGIGITPAVELAEAAGLRGGQRCRHRRPAAHLRPGGLRLRRRRVDRSTRCWAGGSGSSTGRTR